VGLVYASGILPGVRAGGVSLGGLSVQEAEARLNAEWTAIRVQDISTSREQHIAPTDLGLLLDSAATAAEAYAQGRSQFSAALAAFIGRMSVHPVVRVDADALTAGLTTLATSFDQPPVNAGVRFTDGVLETTEPQLGRAVDVNATAAAVAADPGAALRDGTLKLVMASVAPAVTDAAPMLEAARALLANPLELRAYDPVTGDSVYWPAPPEQWAGWLRAEPDATRVSGLRLQLEDAPARAYFTAIATNALDSSRYVKWDEAVAALQTAVSNQQTIAAARVYHHDLQHTVQPGETIISIAWDYGVPYLYIVQANGGLGGVSAGQVITIPTPDTFLPYAPNPDKRIVVSMREQRTRVYENGALKWDWSTSTGISDSPTWPGVYQVISHEPNAYAGNWNLWMPSFMGVYQPIPGADFTNGFHGFPTRGGSQILWTNSLGTRVTYGCILLSNENAQALYNWAETGVVVDIQS
jgi:lipoprotein-anchoring transpeptidase ErfK/SrfK